MEISRVQITNHTELLNYLAKKHNLKNYLEIGVQEPKNNFDKIQVPDKISVDPDPAAKALFKNTSDDFFKYVSGVQTRDKVITNYDLIFIDGLHHADQVKRDFENSLRCLNDGGFIVIHDTLPEDESTTHVPRDSKVWHGDVYKFAMHISQYLNIYFKTVDMDNGCTIVQKSHTDGRCEFTEPVTWQLYLKERNRYMQIIQPSEIEAYF